MAYKFLNEMGLSHIFTIVKNALKGKSDTNHTHLYAGSSSVGGSATSAEKLNSNAGSATQPIYFSGGVPVKTTYTLGASVPSNAKFTDTVYTLPNATSSVLGGVKVGTNISVSSGTISVANASTSAKGVVQLSSATDSTSTSLAATASAVKSAYDLANGKQSPATTLAGYGIANAYTKTEVDALISSLQTKITELENKLSQIPDDGFATVATTGSYKDLTDLPTKLNEVKDY